eukprot:5460813-Pyramimonas_sp.AAC.1
MQALHDYLVAVEGQRVSVSDAGTAAVRTLHDGILALRQVFAIKVHGTTDPNKSATISLRSVITLT